MAKKPKWVPMVGDKFWHASFPNAIFIRIHPSDPLHRSKMILDVLGGNVAIFGLNLNTGIFTIVSKSNITGKVLDISIETLPKADPPYPYFKINYPDDSSHQQKLPRDLLGAIGELAAYEVDVVDYDAVIRVHINENLSVRWWAHEGSAPFLQFLSRNWPQI